MNKLVALCGVVMIGLTATANTLEEQYPIQDVSKTEFRVSQKTNPACITCREVVELDIKDIVFMEEEAPIDLGFDTSNYLPEDFDPYKMYIDLDAIPYIEAENEEELQLETAAWLPEGFDPYAAPADIKSISYMEEEEIFDPELDTKAWLPAGFDPYAPAAILSTRSATVVSRR